MEFAKKQLLKYGWNEGESLGKSQKGITSAIIPKMKSNKEGIGFNAAEEYTNNWWDRVFNEAASNIDVKNQEEEPKIVRKRRKPIEVSVKKSKKRKRGPYNAFVQGPTVDGNKETVISDDDSSEKSEINTKVIISDEELFKACGGRTAHKGARHGLSLKGKLARLEKQDASFLNKSKPE